MREDAKVPDGGLYVLLIRLPRRRRIRVGRLGRFDFAAGWYLYVGSAQRNRSARLARHARRDKPLHWHVDHLLAAGRLVAAFEVPGGAEVECRLAAHLAAALGLHRRPPRMGASDCRCEGHVLYASKRPAVAAALRRWPAASAGGRRGGALTPESPPTASAGCLRRPTRPRRGSSVARDTPPTQSAGF